MVVPVLAVAEATEVPEVADTTVVAVAATTEEQEEAVTPTMAVAAVAAVACSVLVAPEPLGKIPEAASEAAVVASLRAVTDLGAKAAAISFTTWTRRFHHESLSNL